MGSMFCFPLIVTGDDNVDSIRLYSTKSCKPLGMLQYHKVACQALDFAHAEWADTGDEDEEDDVKVKVKRWLVSGGKDHRAVIWELMDFNKKRKGATIK